MIGSGPFSFEFALVPWMIKLDQVFVNSSQVHLVQVVILSVQPLDLHVFRALVLVFY